MKLNAYTCIFILLLTAAPAAFGCSVCGCSLSSDWAAQGYSTQPGWDAAIRYEYSNQTDLRSGLHAVNRSSISFPTDDEVQQRTLNRITWLDLNYVVNSAWSLNASVPFIDRFHSTIAGGDTDLSVSKANGLGDARILASYLTPIKEGSVGFQFGLKLPTGGIHQNFSDGPQSGQPLDRGLQLGTGTYDVLLRASWFTRPLDQLGVFAQVQLSQPLAAREAFLPSTTLTASGGVRWLNSSILTPQIQLNVKTDSREHGANSDTPNSGGTIAYLSPGLTAEITEHSNTFLFVQLPVYQHVNGLQLEPKWLLSTGLRWKF